MNNTIIYNIIILSIAPPRNQGREKEGKESKIKEIRNIEWKCRKESKIRENKREYR